VKTTFRSQVRCFKGGHAVFGKMADSKWFTTMLFPENGILWGSSIYDSKDGTVRITSAERVRKSNTKANHFLSKPFQLALPLL
jgi:hypothetical protein